MPEIQAFHGLRYDAGHVGSLSNVIAPPYDVIDPQLQNDLYRRHPANVIRLILNRQESGDTSPLQCYGRAAQFLKNWRREGLLQLEPKPALYVYHQVFDHDGASRTRRGFMGRVRLQRFGQGDIYAHEETHAAPKADRLHLIRATRANLSPVFGLYPDPGREAQALVDKATAGRLPLEATDHLGVIHRLWPVSDLTTIAELSAVMHPKPVYIADGHHRYETACDFLDELAASKTLHSHHAANFILMMCVGMSDPGMIVLPTHRLFRGFPPVASDELIERLGAFFVTRIAGSGTDAAKSIWQEIQSQGEQGTLGLFAGRDQTWIVARITDAGRAKMVEVAPEHSDQWRSLGVSILHRLVIDRLLGLADVPKPLYVHCEQETIDHLKRGDLAGRDATGQPGTGQPFPLAALVMPASVEHVRSISEGGERMPAKSTYFYPKLLSGLVINPLE